MHFVKKNIARKQWQASHWGSFFVER